MREPTMSEDDDKKTAAPSTYERLSARFPTEVHKRVNKGGGDQTYVPASDVIARLNDVLGVGSWAFRIVREGFTETEAWVLGELTAWTAEDGKFSRQQYGNESIVMGKAQRPTSDLLKKAGTDALKKCATLIGVALYLYDEDERNEVEQEMREAKRPKPPAPATPKVAAAAVVTGADPTVLQAKAELEARLKKGLEYARSLGLDPKDVDPKSLNRAELEDTIESLLKQCKTVLAEQRRQGMVV
jgi:hypothetical protein